MGREKGRRGGETENANSNILFYKDCSLDSVKNLTTSPHRQRERERERGGGGMDYRTDGRRGVWLNRRNTVFPNYTLLALNVCTLQKNSLPFRL